MSIRDSVLLSSFKFMSYQENIASKKEQGKI